MPELTDLTACVLSSMVANGKASCLEIMQAHLARIHSLNPTINAVVALRDDDELLAEAKAADQRAPRGWMHGLPIAIKDLAETANIKTTWGSPMHAEHVPAADCDMVSRIKAAGAIVIGKTNTPEFGLGSHSYNPVYGTTLNPYDRRVSAGGSSGGAAAALAARLVPIADGSDMMGSLRNPAAFCNVYGFRPTVELLADPNVPTEWSPYPLATTGPMGRSIHDIAALLDTMLSSVSTTGHSTLGEGHFLSAVTNTDKQLMKGLRVGSLSRYFDDLPMEAGVMDLCEQALEQLGSQGAHIDMVSLERHTSSAQKPPDMIELFDAWKTLRSRYIAWLQQDTFKVTDKRAMMKPELQWEIEYGIKQSPTDISRAVGINERWKAVLAHLFKQFDLLSLPSATVFPFDANLTWPTSIDDHKMQTYHQWMSVVIPASLQGLPTLAIPAGFNSSGLPAGLQLMGQKGDDKRVLQIGQLYHEATNWPAAVQVDDDNLKTAF